MLAKTPLPWLGREEVCEIMKENEKEKEKGGSREQLWRGKIRTPELEQ